MPSLDAEVIALGYTFYHEVGIKQVTVEINSVGKQPSRENYKVALNEALTPTKEQLIEDLQSRISRNPMLFLDINK